MVKCCHGREWRDRCSHNTPYLSRFHIETAGLVRTLANSSCFSRIPHSFPVSTDHCQPSADAQDLSGDVIGLRATEEDYCVRDLLRLAKTAHRDGLDEGVQIFFPAFGDDGRFAGPPG